jgi:nucleotide-binding universal stress UspA family protein
MKPGIGSYIMDTVTDAGADLVVMGAKGHSHVERLLMGSVTEKVLALTTQIPVLVVK